MSNLIETAEDGGILRVALNRPDKKNALLPGMYAALAETFERFNTDDSLRVLMLEARGDAFCAGNDMSSFVTPDDNDLDNFPTWRVLAAAIRSDKPLVAAVNGPAVGIGATLLLHFDYVIASENATFHMPFVNLGAVPEGGASLLLPQAIGWRGAAEFLLAGDKMPARRAWQLGLINHMVEKERLETETLAAARRIADKPPQAVRQAKRLMKGDVEPVLSHMREEFIQFGERIKSAEMREAVTAFLQKRKPDFSKL